MLVLSGSVLLLNVFALFLFTFAKDAPIIPLPRALHPISYNLSLEILLPPTDTEISNETTKNYGAVTIKINVVEETDKIILNSANITIIRCRLVSINGKDVSNELTNITYNVPSQLVTIMSPFKFAVNHTFQLTVDYTLIIHNDGFGLFDASYREDNITHHAATTQFQSMFARRMVPCFDDPSIRTTWTVEVKTPVGYTVLSNTELAADPTPAGPGFTLTRFKPTPPIPLYLLAIAVHDYPYLENVTSTGILYRFYGQQSKLDACSDAFEFTGRIIDHLVQRFKIVDFPSTKVDFIETNGLSSAGMENIGLITVNSKYFCNATIRNDYFARLVIHELIHQWFGNIVTMKDWSNSIMSEGLTEYYTNIVAREVVKSGSPSNPSNELALYGKTPLIVKPTLIKEIPKVVGLQLYQKGRFAFTMLEKLIGRTNFDNVSNTYLKQNAYGWGTLDMFLALANEQPSNLSLPVSKTMKPYFTEVGFPVVFVEKHPGYFNVTPLYANDNFAFNTSAFITKKKDFFVPIWYRPVDEIAETLVIAEIGKPFNIISNATAVFIDPSGMSLHRTVYVDDLVLDVEKSITGNMTLFINNFQHELHFHSICKLGKFTLEALCTFVKKRNPKYVKQFCTR